MTYLKNIFTSIWFKLIISLLLLIIVFRNVSLVDIVNGLQKIPLSALIGYLAINIFVLAVMAMRWQMLALEKFNFKATREFFIATLVSNFYGLFLPTTVGGDAVKWAHITNPSLSRKKLMFSVLIDRVVGMIGMLILSCIAVFVSSYVMNFQLPLFIINTSLIFLFMLICGSLFFIFPHLIEDLFKLPVFKKISRKISPERLVEYIKHNRLLILSMIIVSSVNHLLSFGMTGILGQSVGFDISFLYYFIFVPLINLILLIPISFSGFGANEAASVYFFSLVGVSQKKVLTLTSLGAVFKIILALIGWMVATVDQLTKKQTE